MSKTNIVANRTGDADYEASYMMSNETLQECIKTTHDLLRGTPSATEPYKRLQEHFTALLVAQAARATAVRMKPTA